MTTPEQVPDAVVQAVAEVIKQKSATVEVDATGTKIRRKQVRSHAASPCMRCCGAR